MARILVPFTSIKELSCITSNKVYPGEYEEIQEHLSYYLPIEYERGSYFYNIPQVPRFLERENIAKMRLDIERAITEHPYAPIPYVNSYIGWQGSARYLFRDYYPSTNPADSYWGTTLYSTTPMDRDAEYELFERFRANMRLPYWIDVMSSYDAGYITAPKAFEMLKRPYFDSLGYNHPYKMRKWLERTD